MQMGLREANQNFSKAIKAVKAGQKVVLTERGKPIATIQPFKMIPTDDSAVKSLEAKGLLRPAQKTSALPTWSPRPLKGIPLSRTLREERDQS